MATHTPEQRLLSIAAFLLRQEDPVPWERIREEFHEFYGGSAAAAERKWTRDKEDLRNLGIPISFVHPELGGEGGFVIRPEEFELRDLQLSSEEAAVVWTAGSAAAQMRGNPWRRHVETACDKLRAACKALPPATSVLPVRHAEPADRAQQSKIVDALGKAVHRRKRVTIEYLTAGRGEVSKRDVDVYGFAWRRGHWLFAGYCHTRKELRVFYVSQVRTLTVNQSNPSKADYDIPESFDIGTISRQQPWEFKLHEPVEAVVCLRGDLGPLAERLLPGGRVEESDTEVRVVLSNVRHLPALVRTVLALGPDAELVSPNEGRAIAREMLGSLASRLDAQVGRLA